jgi:hypothetical protein
MPMYNPPYGLWSIWKDLSLLQRGIIGILAVVGIYSLLSAVKVMFALSSMRKLPSGNSAAIQRSLATLSKRCANVREVVVVTFYLFGIVLFLSFQNVGMVWGDGKASPVSLILGNFILDSAFAANVFVVFLVLHLIQWFVSSRVNSFAEHLNHVL